MINGTVSGILGRDAELVHTDNGVARLKFSVASKARQRDGDPITTWVSCSMFGQRAEALSRHLTKGTRVVAVGKLKVWMHDGQAHVGLDVAELDLMGGGQRPDEQRPTPARAPANGRPPAGELNADGHHDDCPF